MTQTSKGPSTSVLTDLLTSHVYDDAVGVVTSNVCDALFAIANSIDRLAAVQEMAAARAAQAQAVATAVMAMQGEDKPGHA